MTKRLIGVTLSLLFMTSLAAATEIGGVNIPDSMMAGKSNLVLNGAGLRKKAMFIKVYAGGLYLQQRSADAGKIIDADEPMAVKMHFIYDGVSSEKLIEAWNEGFAKATGGDIGPTREEIDAFNGLFTGEAKKGDVYNMIYVPEDGLSVYMNGALKGTIRGLPFKRALFTIWFGDDPADPGLKKGMLGR